MFYNLAIPNLLLVLSLLVLGGVSFLIWWKAKAPAALLMLVGFGVSWLIWLFAWIGIFGAGSYQFVGWMFSLGITVAAVGFILTFWTKIQADVERFREMARDKLNQAAQKGDGSAPSSAPPSSAPPPSASPKEGESES